ncbi:MAG TPA: DPP IV N-terminal domain-containing protein [Phycisphaerales bacterium]|nr:DPP IV N-terminal domain-containing protein [Phycisphaerales bacterium]
MHHLRRLTLPLGLCLAITACTTRPAPQQTATSVAQVSIKAHNEDFLRQYAATYRFTLGRPKSITVTPDGKAVLFLRSGPRSFVHDLYEFDVATGKERVLLTAEQVLGGQDEQLTPEEKARRERLRLSSRGITSYELSDDGSKLVVPLSGRLFIIDRATGHRTEIKSDAGAPMDPHLSPDGARLACVRNGEVYVTDLASGQERKVTSGAGGSITNGLPEFVAQEEMGRFRGYWWSPDSTHIVFQQTDTSAMEVFHIADPMHPEAAPNAWPYPRAGGKNADVKLGIVSVDGGDPVWVQWDREQYPYLATVKWPKNAPLTILVQNRTQTDEMLLAVNLEGGSTAALRRERDDAWVNLQQSCPHWLQDGSGFLWLTERTGEWSLVHRAREHAIQRSLTPKGFGLIDLLGADEKHGMAYVIASPDGMQIHLWAVPLAGGEPVRLSTQAGQHSATFAKGGGALGTWVHSCNLADGTVKVLVRRGMEAEPIGELSSAAEEPPFIPNVEFTTVTDRNLRAAIIRPRSFDPARKYPVINSVYGGPHTNVVNATPRSYLLHQWLADQGFIVVSIDARGTPRRGRDWERSIKNNVIDGPLEDQAAAVKALAAKYPEMDITRVGITGWSFGGYFSAMATMRRPDVFKAGVAGAPVCDWQDYDTHYTERYMGLPQENAAGYQASNVLTYCKDLTVPLLIIHGTADDNVYFMHSLKMSEALFRAGKVHDFLPLSGFTHMVPDPNVTVSLQGRIATFLKEHLGEPR